MHVVNKNRNMIRFNEHERQKWIKNRDFISREYYVCIQVLSNVYNKDFFPTSISGTRELS